MGVHVRLLLFLQILYYCSIDANPVGVKSISHEILQNPFVKKSNNIIESIWLREPSQYCNIEKPSVSSLTDEFLFKFNFVPYLCVILYDASLRYIQLNSSPSSNNEISHDIAQKIINETAAESFCQKMKDNKWYTLIDANKQWISNFNDDIKEETSCQRYCVSDGVVNPLCAYALWIDLSVKKGEQKFHKQPQQGKDMRQSQNQSAPDAKQGSVVSTVKHLPAESNNVHVTAEEASSNNMDIGIKRGHPLSSGRRPVTDTEVSMQTVDLSGAAQELHSPSPGRYPSATDMSDDRTVPELHQEQAYRADNVGNQSEQLLTGNKLENSVQKTIDKNVSPNKTVLTSSGNILESKTIQDPSQAGTYVFVGRDIVQRPPPPQHTFDESSNLLKLKSPTRSEYAGPSEVTKSNRGSIPIPLPKAVKPQVEHPDQNDTILSDASHKTKEAIPAAPEVAHVDLPTEKHLDEKHSGAEGAVSHGHKGPPTSTHRDNGAEGLTSPIEGQDGSPNMPSPADLRQSSIPEPVIPEPVKNVVSPEDKTEKERINTTIPVAKVKEEPAITKGELAVDQIGKSESEDANQANEGDLDDVPGEPADHEEQKALEDSALGSRGEEGDAAGTHPQGRGRDPEEDVMEQDVATEEQRFNGAEDALLKPDAAKKQVIDYSVASDEDEGVWNRDPGRIAQNDADVGYAHDRFVDAEDSHFFAYFMTMIILCIIGYLIFHNKQKILALALEGRVRKGSRRRPSTSGYRKLDSNLEEAVTSSCTGSSVTHVIY